MRTKIEVTDRIFRVRMEGHEGYTLCFHADSPEQAAFKAALFHVKRLHLEAVPHIEVTELTQEEKASLSA